MLPGTRCQVLGWQTPGGVELTRPGQILAPDLGTGGLFLGLRLRLQRRGAEDGAGQSPGNRLDDVTLTGGGRVPQGRESCGRLEHPGICSPGGAGRSLGHSLLESGAIHFTDSKSEDQKIEGALAGKCTGVQTPTSLRVQGKNS